MVLRIIENHLTSRFKLLNINAKLNGFEAFTTNLIVLRKRKKIKIEKRDAVLFIQFEQIRIEIEISIIFLNISVWLSNVIIQSI